MSILNLSSRIDSRDLIDRLSALGVDEWHAVDYDETDAADRTQIDALVDALTVLYDSSMDTPEDGIFGVAVNEWVDYARELAEDIGAMPSEDAWPSRHIDWAAAARALAQDYSLVTIDGSDWYVR